MGPVSYEQADQHMYRWDLRRKGERGKNNIQRNNDWKFTKSGEKYSSTNLRSSMNFKQDKFKGTHTKANFN